MKRIPKVFLRSQVTNYIIFLVGRVGSSYLTSLLNSHPDIFALQEELAELPENTSSKQLEWTRQYFNPPLLGRHHARGFNVKLVQLIDPDGFAQLLEEKRCKIIHLTRRNRIKAVVSHINGKRLAEKTGMWGLYDQSKRLPPFSIDTIEFDNVLKKREKNDNDLKNYVDHLSLPKLFLSYEDILVDLHGTLNEVFSFLGVAPHTVHSDSLKITSDNLREDIINIDELRAQYIGTQYEHMFDEVTTPVKP